MSTVWVQFSKLSFNVWLNLLKRLILWRNSLKGHFWNIFWQTAAQVILPCLSIFLCWFCSAICLVFFQLTQNHSQPTLFWSAMFCLLQNHSPPCFLFFSGARDLSNKHERSYLGFRQSCVFFVGPQEFLANYPHNGHHFLQVRVSKGLTQTQLTRLFNIVPSLESCRLVTTQFSNTGDYCSCHCTTY